MTEFFLEISPTIRLLVTLLAVVLGMRAGLAMGWCLFGGTALLGLLFPTPLAGWVDAFAVGLFGVPTLFLLFIVAGLLVFSAALNETGQIKRIIDAFRSIVGRSRWSLVTFPALIGLLPMPGGAIFSAPMVAASVEENELTPTRISVANYWFRHIWEYWLPLYPGVILTLSLTGAPVALYTGMQIPMTLVALLAGWVIILRGVRLGQATDQKHEVVGGEKRRFVSELTPILLMVGCVLALDPVLGRGAAALGWSDDVRRLSIPVGLVASLTWLVRRRNLAPGRIVKLAIDPKVLSMLFLVLGVMVFQAMMRECGAVPALRAEFERYAVPLPVVVCGLPFLAGLVLGIAVGFVGASFPLVIVLLSGIPESERLAYYFLAYVAGYIGMMLSPVHLCFVVTGEYFKARMLRMYAYLLPIAALSFAGGVLLFGLYRLLQGLL